MTRWGRRARRCPDQPQGTGQVEHCVLLRGQAGASRSRIWSQTAVRSSVASAMPLRPPMHSTPAAPATRRFRSPECVAVDPVALWIPRAHSFHTGVHRVCTAGEGAAQTPLRTGPRSHHCRSEADSGGATGVRRSVDDGSANAVNDVRRERRRATHHPQPATTEKPPGERTVVLRRAAASPEPAVDIAVGIFPATVANRLGYLGGLWAVRRVPCPAGCGGAGGRRSDQLPGSSGYGTSPSVPAAPAFPPTGGDAPSMSCSGSTS